MGGMRKPKPVIADNIGVFYFCNCCESGCPPLCVLPAKFQPDGSTAPFGRLVKRIEDAERKQKNADEMLQRELTKSKELEIRWKAICCKKDSDLAECRHKMARLQVEVSSKPAFAQSSWPLSPSSGSPRKRLPNIGDLDSISAVSMGGPSA